MKWKFWCPDSEVDLSASRRGLEEARIAVDRTERKSEEVKEVTSRLRSIREENHFIEHLDAVLGGRK